MTAHTPTTGLGVFALSIDCADPAPLAEFWGKVLDRPVSPGPTPENVVVEATDPAKGPLLFFAKVPEAKAGKNRLHLDLVVPDVKSAVDSALDLGARRAEGELGGSFPWTVMLDPEGNEFCLCPPTAGNE